jgi:hypothetical protein
MKIRQALAAGGLVVACMAGGAVGATLLGTANAATPTPTPSTGTSGSTPSTGGFHSNEDPTHEAGESAAREAAENNGTATYGPPAGATSTAPSAG